ncbi:uncharacterized protein LOC124814367 [Hydra vulgaris]|uniref:uncharacterized protein LOC124814367 n=1 Tax=Hydra vulgaris TaxID=6087 RepID=UPI001F5FC425|nr:uncharacterized protein LOC124814367 [Hydra vulgaris]
MYSSNSLVFPCSTVLSATSSSTTIVPSTCAINVAPTSANQAVAAATSVPQPPQNASQPAETLDQLAIDHFCDGSGEEGVMANHLAGPIILLTGVLGAEGDITMEESVVLIIYIIILYFKTF